MKISDFAASATEREAAGQKVLQTETTNAVNSGIVGKADKSSQMIKEKLFEKGRTSVLVSEDGKVAMSFQSGSCGHMGEKTYVRGEDGAFHPLETPLGGAAELEDEGGKPSGKAIPSRRQAKSAAYSAAGLAQSPKNLSKGALASLTHQTLEDTELEGSDTAYHKVNGIRRFYKRHIARKTTQATKEILESNSLGKLSQKKYRVQKKDAQQLQRTMQTLRNERQAIQSAKAAKEAAAARSFFSTSAAGSGGGGIAAAGLLAPILFFIFGIVLVLLIVCAVAGDEEESSDGGYSEAVESWRSTVYTACEDCGLDTKWVNAILALMTIESGGDLNCSCVNGYAQDIMQACEGAYGDIMRCGSSSVLLQGLGITPSLDFEGQTATASIYAGVLEFKDNLSLWESWLGEIDVTDTGILALVVQGYNFGKTGWYLYCKGNGITVYSVETAQVYSDTRMPAGAKGTPSYGQRFLNAYIVPGENASLVSAAIAIAGYDTHGYSQSSRTLNPDVDCSSFVYYAMLQAGYSTDQLGAAPFTTATMTTILESVGYTRYDFTSVDSLSPSDILWRTSHTEIYVGNGQTAGAHTDYDGRAGDSSGQEINVSTCTSDWQYYFRK